MSKPLFPLGRVFATPQALELFTQLEISSFLARHVQGDWGAVSAENAAANDRSVRVGARIFSAYEKTHEGASIKAWIITEPDRVSTTVLLPSEY
jgi:hypothetical protein